MTAEVTAEVTAAVAVVGEGAREVKGAHLLSGGQPRLTARLLVPLAQLLVLATLPEQRVDDLERRLRKLRHLGGAGSGLGSGSGGERGAQAQRKAPPRVRAAQWGW